MSEKEKESKEVERGTRGKARGKTGDRGGGGERGSNKCF
jgi:hypothetical protein